ncbi:MAG TPA: HipA domain-containing protein [Gammaproteobacteria bacterium]|nr:HipA domain-containing protein [Gammaproteobacteria bacterium]
MNCLKCRRPIENPDDKHYGLHHNCFAECFGITAPAEFTGLQRRSNTSSDKTASMTPQNTSFFHGKFKKYSAELGSESYILKMRQTEAPELPEVEYLCNQIAKTIGIAVADFYYIDFNGERIFVTKIFIKPGTSPIDLQHIYHFRPDDQHSCEGIINAIIATSKRPIDVKIFIKTVLFDALIGNHDRHGRNLAFIITAKNTILSPIYDNVSYLSLESGNMLKADFNPAGKITTQETNEPSMKDYVKEFKRLGYQDIVIEFYQSIKEDQIDTLIKESFCSQDMKVSLSRLIKKRFKELENELSN